MIIPDDNHFSQQADQAWEFAAAQIGIEHGIIVEIGRELEQCSYPNTLLYKTRRIFFKLNGYEFETLTDLKRALQLKAFL